MKTELDQILDALSAQPVAKRVNPTRQRVVSRRDENGRIVEVLDTTPGSDVAVVHEIHRDARHQI